MESRESLEIALSVISCLLHEYWAPPTSVSCSLGIYPTYPSQFAGQPGDTNTLFYEKVKGLVLQCCGTASPILALQLLRALPLPEFQQSISIATLSANTWIEIMEVTLRSYFVNVNTSNIFSDPVSLLQIDIRERSAIIDLCINTCSGCTLLVILYHWKQELQVQQSGPISWPSCLFEVAVRFVPARYRTFDRLLFWFFCLELVNSDSFHPVRNQNESWILLNHLKEISQDSTIQKNDPYLI